VQDVIAFVLGFALETTSFMYTCVLPLQVARDITSLKLKQLFSRQALDPNTHSFVGTVVGAMLGATFINDTMVFANVNFLVKRLEGADPKLILATVLLTLVASLACLSSEIKKELLKIPCIRRCFPKKIRSYTVSHMDYQ
jgi:hypothetical protein